MLKSRLFTEGFNRLFHQRGMSFHIRYHFFIIPGAMGVIDYFCSPDDFIADLNQSFGLGNPASPV
jgi:hypothetical protein